MRRDIPALAKLDRNQLETKVLEAEKILRIHRYDRGSKIISWLNFGSETVNITENIPSGTWKKLLDSSEETWGGTGSQLPEKLDATTNSTMILNPYSVVIYSHQ